MHVQPGSAKHAQREHGAHRRTDRDSLRHAWRVPLCQISQVCITNVKRFHLNTNLVSQFESQNNLSSS